MASTTHTMVLRCPPNATRSHNAVFSLHKTTTTTLPRITRFSSYSTSTTRSSSRQICASSRPMEALIFDCDGVILESEDLHRQAYNFAFAHFNVRCPPFAETLNWSTEFYDVLQNQIGGGKPKMRWYFKENGWPSSTLFATPPESDEDRAKLIDTLQGKKVAVCSAATKSSVVMCLENLIGMERFQSLDCFLAGDDVKEKKPDPSIYITASKAATQAGMSCIITYTSSTANQDFSDAIAKFPDLSDVRLEDLEELLENTVAA
ncbi:haloacid dehalogenase-like hydrolase domain-containing protein [Tanacetum coccineum]